MMRLHQAAKLAPEPLAYERVSLQEATRWLEDERPAYKKDWKLMRQPPQAEQLLHATSSWLAGLPAEIQTWALAQRFPRITNELARLWRTPVQWERYMSNLLLVRRGDNIRQGFPPQVARELAALSSYYTSLRPTVSDVVEWGVS